MARKKITPISIPKPDFTLIAIASHLPDYMLCMALNEKLQFNFSQQPDIKLPNNKTFSRYHYYKEELFLKFDIISNRCDDGFLINELHTIDYFLRIKEDSTQDINQTWLLNLLEKIKSTQGVITAFKVDINQKFVTTFIFD